jgi:hypothetical protein
LTFSYQFNAIPFKIFKNSTCLICWNSVFIPTPLVFRFFCSFGGARVAQWVRSLDLTAHISLSPIRRGFAPSFANYKKGCTRLAAANDNVYQLLAQGWWFFPVSPASSTTKTGRHDIAEILLKVALKHQKSNQIKSVHLGFLFNFQFISICFSVSWSRWYCRSLSICFKRTSTCTG